GPDSRLRRRWQERSCDGQRLSDPGAGGRDREDAQARVDAARARGEQGTALRVEQRRLDDLSQSVGEEEPAGTVAEGSLQHVLGVRQRSKAAVERRRADGALSLPL